MIKFLGWVGLVAVLILTPPISGLAFGLWLLCVVGIVAHLFS